MDNPTGNVYLSEIKKRFGAIQDSKIPLFKKFARPDSGSMSALQRLVKELSEFYIQEPDYRDQTLQLQSEIIDYISNFDNGLKKDLRGVRK